MTEAFLQYVWQHQLMCTDRLCTLENESITILKVGVFNSNAGPDFLNAKIKIGTTIWAGDIEIHIKSSDWDVHKHSLQKTYNSVILHAVLQFDKEIYTENGTKIPTLVMPILPHITENYLRLSDVQATIKCANQLKLIEPFHLHAFMERLVAERFEEKSTFILNTLKQTGNDWEETFYQHLARNFGFKINADAFVELTKSLPLKILEKHSNNLFQIEALLFGQANIWKNSTDEYEISLHKEYTYLQKKYQLQPISATWWKFARMRPYNFPTIRIAQFAKLIADLPTLFSKILEIQNLTDLQALFTIKTSPYWNTHFLFGKETTNHSSTIGSQAIETLIINTIIPFLYTYGKARNIEKLLQRAYDFLLACPPEKNSIITQWEKHNVIASTAYDSQALLQLFNAYCLKAKCTHCAIGHIVLKRQ